MGEGSDHTGSTPMFAIFILSLYSLYLIPYTLYKLCGSGSDDKVRVVRGFTGWASLRGRRYGRLLHPKTPHRAPHRSRNRGAARRRDRA